MVDTIKLNPHHYTDLKGLSIGGTLITTTPAEINTLDGITATVAELNENDLSAVGAVIKLKKLPMTIVASADEQDTGWDLPDKCAVLDCWVDVTTEEGTGTTKTVDVGTLSSASGDPDGFLDGISVAAAAVVKGEPTAAGTTTNKYWNTCTKGALLCTFNAGASGTGGLYAPVPCTAPGSKSVTYTLGSSNFAELVANICILYVEIA